MPHCPDRYPIWTSGQLCKLSLSARRKEFITRYTADLAVTLRGYADRRGMGQMSVGRQFSLQREEIGLLELREAIRTGAPIGPAAGSGRQVVQGPTLCAALLSDTEHSGHLWLRHVDIEGDLDLTYFHFSLRPYFEHCKFEGQVKLMKATFPELAFISCRFDGLFYAPELRIDSNLYLMKSEFKAGLLLQRVTVGGAISLINARVEPLSPSDGKPSLVLDQARIDAHVRLDGLRVDGGLSMIDLRTGGQLSLVSAEISHPDGTGPAIAGDGIEVGRGMSCLKLRCSGTLRLSGATVGTQLTLGRARLQATTADGRPGSSLVANGLSVGQDLLCNELHSSGEIRLIGATVGAQLSMARANLEGGGYRGLAIDADRLSVDGSVAFNELRAVGEIRLLGAKFGGQLSMVATRLEVLDEGERDALSLDGAQVNDGVFLNESRVQGAMRFLGARIEGNLALSYSHLSSATSGDCLIAEGCQLSGSFQANRIFARGRIDLTGATISGLADLSESVLEIPAVAGGERTTAFSIERAQVDGGLYLDNTRVLGELRLGGAKVGIQVSLIGARIERDPTRAEVCAINADNMVVTGPFSLSQSRVVGEIRLLGVEIGGQLTMDHARCDADRRGDGSAISLDGSTIRADLICQSMRTNGTVRLVNARVDGQLHASQARLEVPEGTAEALLADGLTVSRGMICRGLECHGTLSMHAAQIEAQLALVGVTLAHGGDAERAALVLTAAEVDELILSPQMVTGLVDFSHTSARILWDAHHGQFVGRYPKQLRLDGFRYDLREPLDAASRLKWIGGSEERSNHPEIYGELANAYRRAGRASEAREVLIAGERRIRRQLRRFELRGLWQDMLWITVGYGYRNRLALYWLISLIAVGAIAFGLERSQIASDQAPPPDFNAFLYSVDATVPILDLGQQSTWIADGSAAWTALVLSICGYVLATAVVAAATGLLSREYNK